MSTNVAILPNGRQQFFDGNGHPLVGGTVTTYIPGGFTPKTTYNDSAGTVPNTNPITLDSLGSAAIWGPGYYRQIVNDSLGNLIWDVVTLAPSSGASGTGGTSVTSFGAKGDGTTDDTAAIQAAINAVRTAGGGIVYYPGPAAYLVTSSLNSTGTHGNQPILHVGDGEYISRIVHTFPIGEAYPVLDGSGNTHGGTSGLTIERQGTSYATCAYLAAKGAAGGSIGNAQQFWKSTFDAGNIAGDCALVVYSADLSSLTNCSSTGNGGGLSMGFDKPANITSKFISLSSELDWTQGYITQCTMSGESDAALTFSGGAQLQIQQSYAALTGSGSSKIININSPNDSGNSLLARGLRTENQSSATGVAAIYLSKGSTSFDIEATLDTDSDGPMIAGSSGANISQGQINVTGNAGSVFSMIGGITDVTLLANISSNVFGTVDATSSYNISVGGNITPASVWAAIGSVQGLRVSQAASVFRSGAEVLIAPGDTTVNGRYSGTFIEQNVSTSSYTGGSGRQNVLALTIPAGISTEWFNGQIPSPSIVQELGGRVNSTNAGSGTIEVELVQGANTVSVVNWSGPPAGNSPGGGLRIRTDLYRSGSVFRTQTTVSWCGTLFESAFLDLGAFTPGGGDIIMNIYITNTGDDPMNIFRQRVSVA